LPAQAILHDQSVHHQQQSKLASPGPSFSKPQANARIGKKAQSDVGIEQCIPKGADRIIDIPANRIMAADAVVGGVLPIPDI
jgi:hypothetical protein